MLRRQKEHRCLPVNATGPSACEPCCGGAGKFRFPVRAAGGSMAAHRFRGAGMRNIGVDADRLWAATMEMGEIGATANGGCHRLALSDEDRRARDLFGAWMREAGCTVTVD